MTSNVCHIWVKPGLASHTCLLATKTYTYEAIMAKERAQYINSVNTCM